MISVRRRGGSSAIDDLTRPLSAIDRGGTLKLRREFGCRVRELSSSSAKSSRASVKAFVSALSSDNAAVQLFALAVFGLGRFIGNCPMVIGRSPVPVPGLEVLGDRRVPWAGATAGVPLPAGLTFFSRAGRSGLAAAEGG